MEVINIDVSIFDGIRHVDENGCEYWFARELMPILHYNLWQNFHGIIKVAMVNCSESNYNILDHFIDTNKMVSIGSNSKRKIQDYKLSRYACYLIVLNCDPRKKVIALAKTYFAVQTRNLV